MANGKDTAPNIEGPPTVYSGGVKFDSEKPRYDLIDSYATDVLAQVLTFGAKKYAPHNWRKGIKLSRLVAAAQRHIFAIANGEENDPETGLPHAGHLQCCAMFITWTQKNLPEMDDLWRDPEKYAPNQKLIEALSQLKD